MSSSLHSGDSRSACVSSTSLDTSHIRRADVPDTSTVASTSARRSSGDSPRRRRAASCPVVPGWRDMARLGESRTVTKLRMAGARALAQPVLELQGGRGDAHDRGRRVRGCNVENVAYPEGVCAEGGAISMMVVGQRRRAGDRRDRHRHHRRRRRAHRAAGAGRRSASSAMRRRSIHATTVDGVGADDDDRGAAARLVRTRSPARSSTALDRARTLSRLVDSSFLIRWLLLDR